jgi:hypothetical protein
MTPVKHRAIGIHWRTVVNALERRVFPLLPGLSLRFAYIIRVQKRRHRKVRRRSQE